MNEDIATTLALKGTDADGEVLSIVVTTPPAHGALVGSSLARSIEPDGDDEGRSVLLSVNVD